MMWAQFKNLTTEELCEIYENLNSWKWDKRVGDEPEGFNDMPKYNRHWYHKLIKRKTKSDYIDPVLRVIRTMVPAKELFRHYNTLVLGKSNEEFEQWWTENGEPYPSWWR